MLPTDSYEPHEGLWSWYDPAHMWDGNYHADNCVFASKPGPRVIWLTIDLGYGNYLFVSKAISDAFSREVEAGDYDTVGVLYQRWLSIVLKILKAPK